MNNVIGIASLTAKDGCCKKCQRFNGFYAICYDDNEQPVTYACSGDICDTVCESRHKSCYDFLPFDIPDDGRVN
jgi:hypothetical protein